MGNMKILPSHRTINSFATSKGHRFLILGLMSLCVILFLKIQNYEKTSAELGNLLSDKELELNNLIAKKKALEAEKRVLEAAKLEAAKEAAKLEAAKEAAESALNLSMKSIKVTDEVKPILENKTDLDQRFYYYTLNKIEKDLLIELNDFNLNSFHNRTNASTLMDLMPKFNGTPITNVIISTFRSGSTFMEDFLGTFPGTFKHHEILMHYGSSKLHNVTIEKLAAADASDMMHCNYDRLDAFMETARRKTNYILIRNQRVYKHLSNKEKYTKEFMADACEMFPVHSFKINRIQLRFAEQFLEDKTLNLRMLFLFRDPRGVINSRLDVHENIYKKKTEEEEKFKLLRSQPYFHPSVLCNDLVDDLDAAYQLIQKYPDRFTVVRYEDFALNTYHDAADLMTFFGLPFHEKMVEFLESHNTEKKGGIYSTFRNGNETVFRWKEDLSYEIIDFIQKFCVKAYEKAGYIAARSEKELKDNFIPVKGVNYNIRDYFEN